MGKGEFTRRRCAKTSSLSCTSMPFELGRCSWRRLYFLRARHSLQPPPQTVSFARSLLPHSGPHFPAARRTVRGAWRGGGGGRGEGRSMGRSRSGERAHGRDKTHCHMAPNNPKQAIVTATFVLAGEGHFTCSPAKSLSAAHRRARRRAQPSTTSNCH